MMTIRIATDFSRTPGSRYRLEGEHSGEAFRSEVLLPAVLLATQSGAELSVDLDGTAGFGTSFLEEAFGGLVRNDGLDHEVLLKTLRFKSDSEPYLIEDIQQYIRDAGSKRK